MSFRRTVSGLSNQYLFFGVDAVVFVEGGRGFSKEEVNLGNFDTSSIDIKFWRGVFRYYYPNKKFQFRATGSKTTLRSIAMDIASGNLKNVYVAMDRDHDKINKKSINTVGVLYTYGYSWENDVWHTTIIKEVYHLVYINATGNKKDDIKKSLNTFFKDIFSSVSSDIFLSYSGRSFFPRDKNPSCIITIGKNKKPSVNSSYIDSLFRQNNLNKRKMTLFGIKSKVNVSRDCYGHLVAEFCYRLISYLISKGHRLPRIAKHYVGCLAIDKFLSCFSSGEFALLHKHYKRYFNALTI